MYTMNWFIVIIVSVVVLCDTHLNLFSLLHVHRFKTVYNLNVNDYRWFAETDLHNSVLWNVHC